MNPNLPIRALACDYDETLACNGRVAAPALEALARFRASGGKVVLITGRELNDLLSVCPDLCWFDLVVAENGALLVRPATEEAEALANRPPEEFVQQLIRRGVRPLSIGRSIVATVRQHRATVSQTIADMQLDLEIILNRSSLMILPTGVHKGTGLTLALEELRVPPAQVAGIGDAENDDAFLSLCGCYAAVANALPAIKEAADLVTDGNCGAGVVEVIDRAMAGDLCRTQAHR
jgi:hydroxymethylpyrimidine pyrophosphatase-like HAD family hydrolase